MTNKDISNKINKLKSIARFGRHQFMNLSKDAFVRIFGEGKNAVSFLAVSGVTEFENISKYLYNSDAKIFENYSLNTFQEELCGLLKVINIEQRECNLNDWNTFCTNLTNKSNITVKTIAPIYGVVMNQDIVTLDKFTIYKSSKLINVLESEFTNILNIKYKLKTLSPYNISINTTSKDIQKCYELADMAFSKFENIANFIAGGFHKTYKIGIFNYLPTTNTISLRISKNKITKSLRSSTEFELVQIDNPRFQSSDNGNDKIWKLITEVKSDLETKIIDSIEWVGKAVVDIDDTKALLQYIISIESLLQYDEDKFIAPSIVSHLSDMVAFLIGENYRQRLEYVSYIKELYKIRSSITHSGKGNLNNISLHSANVICHKIISKILTSEPYTKFLTKQQLCKHLIQIKFGNPET